MTKHSNVYYDQGSANLSPIEQSIATKFEDDWDISWARTDDFKFDRLSGQRKTYSYIFVRPRDKIIKTYLLDVGKEILVLFTDDTEFNNRTFDFVDRLVSQTYNNRLNSRLVLLISRDNTIHSKIRELIKGSGEVSRVVVAFTYDEFLLSSNLNTLWDRFIQSFDERDLFGFHNPLHTEFSFFGRTFEIEQLKSRHKQGENTGLFGLRRVGKTSALLALMRRIKDESICIRIDCESPSVHNLQWNELIKLISLQIVQTTKSQIINDENSYNTKNVTVTFENILLNVSKTLNKRIILIFDEIQYISFNMGEKEHWKNGDDYIEFWSALRSIQQNHPNLFTYIISGVDPSVAETDYVIRTNGTKSQNPIYRGLEIKYLLPFEREKVKEMVVEIGRYMGLRFDEDVFTYLTDEYGGHPFIIRLVCSILNQKIIDTKLSKPFTINKIFYRTNKESINNQLVDYIELILNILREYYKLEYEVLQKIAIGNPDNLQYNSVSQKTISHLIGYGLIKLNEQGKPDLTIDAVGKYLREHSEITPRGLTNDEKCQFIMKNIGELENRLRKLIQLTLSIKFRNDEIKAKSAFIESIQNDNNRKEKLKSISFRELFTGTNSEVYFYDLRRFVDDNWKEFEYIFQDKNEFTYNSNLANQARKDAAHFKPISDDSFAKGTKAIKYLDDLIEKNLLGG